MAPTTIRAAVLERPGVAARIEELTLDEPREGEIRVRMAASGVCHSDLHVRDGEWDRPGPIKIRDDTRFRYIRPAHLHLAPRDVPGRGVDRVRVGDLLQICRQRRCAGSAERNHVTSISP